MTTHTRPSNAPPWVQVVHRPSGRVVFTGRLDTARRVVGDDDRLTIRPATPLPKDRTMKPTTPMKTIRDGQPGLSDAQRRRLARTPVKYRGLYAKALAGKTSPRTAIRVKCLECMGWERMEIPGCTSPTCPLFHCRPYQESRQVAEGTSCGAPDAADGPSPAPDPPRPAPCEEGER